jgi:hypothetical protein
MLDKDLHLMASEWADKVIHKIVAACHSPEYKLEGDDLDIYSELKEFGWFEQFPIDDEVGERAIKLHLTVRKYGKLKWAKDHPPKTEHKMSKWEKVYGKLPKRR